jgi:hypothetical protein
MKTVLIAWGVIILICFLEAYFCSELDPESKKFLEERENKLNKEKNGNKSTS